MGERTAERFVGVPSKAVLSAGWFLAVWNAVGDFIVVGVACMET
jgi:hypothetical protein